MTDQDFSELLLSLEATPETVKQLTGSLSEVELKWKPSENEFSALEQVCHLRDIELEAYTIRIQRLLSESQPSLPDIDGGRLAVERDYNNQKLEAALHDFARARLENIRMLHSVSAEQLNLTGVLEGVGEITLGGLLHFVREHDQAHLDEMTGLSRRLSKAALAQTPPSTSSAAPR